MISIADALFTKTQQRVLGLLYGKPDEAFYTNQIVRLANMGSGTVVRELVRLADAGLLVTRQEGNQLYYQANVQSPIYAELLSMIKKTFGVVDVLRSVLKPIIDQIDSCFVYGSVAKGSATSKSDVDVLIVADKLAYVDLMTLLQEAEVSLSRPVNPSIYSAEQLKLKLNEKNAFVQRVLTQEKIWIKGSDDDLRKFIQN